MDAAVQEAKDQAELNDLLIWASARGLLADGVELIARGAELAVKDKQGRFAVHYAAAHGHLDLLQYLATKGADIEAEDPNARLPLHYAAVSNSIEVLRFLIQRSTWLAAPDAADDTALHLAARRGWVQGVQLLLSADAAADVPNKRGLTALGEAVASGHAAAAEAMIKAGADVLCRTAGYTLLHVAAGLGQKDTLQLLLQQPAAAALINDTANSDAASPLHAAAMAGSAACVQLLLKHGADAKHAGSGGLQPWELVPADSSSTTVQQLQKQLQEAAGVKAGTAAKKPHSPATSSADSVAASSKSSSTARKAATAGDEGVIAGDPVTAYSSQFARLNGTEQGRKVDTFARMSEAELTQLDFLNDDARQAIGQVRRAHQLLACYRAVSALRSDEQFQEDASDPGVQAALQEMAMQNNMEKFSNNRQVMSVAAKLKKFHTVIQESGGIRLGLQDVLVKPGQSLSQLMDQDAKQIEGLTAAAAAARNAAVAAITGRPVETISSTTEVKAAASPAATVAGAAGGVKKGFLSKPASVPAAVSSEVSAADDSAAPGELDLDAQLQHHKKQKAAAAPKHPDDMQFGERMRYELVNSFIQAVKIMGIVCLIWGVMWCLGLLPGQQDTAELERRLAEAVQNQEQHMQQAAAEAVGAPHAEL